MKIANICKMMIALVASSLLFACGGGGGGNVQSGTVVNGVARAGAFTKGKVTFFGYSGASKNKPYFLKFQNFSSPTGAFSSNVGSYAGPLRLEVTGSYTDEVTGKLVQITPANPMKALVAPSAVTNGVVVPVTPLTDIAADKTLTAGISETNINQNNQGVAKLFGLTDVTKTVPVMPTAANLTATTSSEVVYAVALAKLSQYVAECAASSSGSTVGTVSSDALAAAVPVALAQLSNGINVSTTGTGTSATTTVAITTPDLKNSLDTIMASTTVTVGGAAVTVPATTASKITDAVTTAGSTVTVYKYSLYASGAAVNTVYGLKVSIQVPAGVTIAADANGNVPSTAIFATPVGGIINAKLSGQTLTITYAAGKAVLTDGGQLATIVCSIPDAADPPALAPVTLFAFDGGTQDVAGVTVTTAPPVL